MQKVAMSGFRWSNPILARVDKPPGEARPCGDLRRLPNIRLGESAAADSLGHLAGRSGALTHASSARQARDTCVCGTILAAAEPSAAFWGAAMLRNGVSAFQAKVHRLFMRRRSAWPQHAIAICAFLFSCAPVVGQCQSYYDRTENVPVSSRPQPEYDAVGYEADGFTFFPKVTFKTIYDDNIYGLPQQTSDFVFVAQPSLSIDSDWGRNMLDFEIRYERDQYLDHGSQSSNEFSASTTGRLDVDHASAITGSFSAAQLTEARTDPDSIATLAEPVQYDEFKGSIAAFREFNRFRLDASVSDSYLNYSNTPLIGGGYYAEYLRDENAVAENFRVSYALNPDVNTYVEVSPRQEIFVHPITKGSLGYEQFGEITSLNSDGFSILAGANAQLTHLITGDVGVGYLQEDYQDTAIGKVTGVAFNARVQYFPTQLLTVTATAQHSVEPSGLPGTPSLLDTGGKIGADYELLRNLIISPNLSYDKLDYPGSSRVDSRLGAWISLNYLINRAFGVSLSYSYLQQSSIGANAGSAFNDDRVTLSLTIQR
jgi:hypothetical protein